MVSEPVTWFVDLPPFRIVFLCICSVLEFASGKGASTCGLTSMLLYVILPCVYTWFDYVFTLCSSLATCKRVSSEISPHGYLRTFVTCLSAQCSSSAICEGAVK